MTLKNRFLRWKYHAKYRLWHYIQSNIIWRRKNIKEILPSIMKRHGCDFQIIDEYLVYKLIFNHPQKGTTISYFSKKKIPKRDRDEYLRNVYKFY